MLEELLQKIKFVLENKNEAQAERILEQFIFYQEELTIEFGEWLRIECYDIGGNWLYQQDDEVYTTAELYKIFKEERLK
jgi:hypothetical protein